ncbi:MAG: metallophosphoesterase [Pirellulales bacterium]|nr:metallophosphoesterase [Pirellulales bacterium]
MFCRRFLVGVATIVVAFMATPLLAATTLWDFQSNLDASSGYSVLDYRDATTQTGTSFGVTDGLTVPNIESQQVGYMSFPRSGNPGGFLVDRSYDDLPLHSYTLAWDVLVPASSFNSYSYMGLFNANPVGTDDAEFYIDLRTATAGQLFADRDRDNSKVYSSSTGIIQPDTWHRIVWAYDQNDPVADIRFFVDGVKVGASDTAFGETGFSLPNYFPVFQDGGPQMDHAPGLVASMALVDRALTDGEIVSLGGPKAAGFAAIADPGPPPTPPAPPTPAIGFNLAFLPDTQNEAEGNPAMFQSQVDWIVKNRVSQKIAFVGHLGDITDNGNVTEYNTSHTILFQLDSAQNLPWGVCAGNHDIGTTAKNALFDQYFGPTNFAGKEWYGDTTCQQSSYQIFSARGRDYLVLDIQYAGDSEVLAWAQDVIDANPDMPTIVNTHMYFTPDGGYEPYATTIWDGLIDDNSQIFLVVCGHHDSQGPKYATRTNAAGQVVYELMTDYQQTDYGGGYLRLLNFDEENSVIHASVYSPYYDLDHDVFPYDQFNIAMDFDARLGPAATPGDANCDGQVDEADARILAQHWLTEVVDWRQGDFNGDGKVDDLDASILAAHWRDGVAAEHVPEPSTLVLLLGLLLVAVARRRKG